MMGGGGEGDFQLARFFFFFHPLLVQEFFLQVKPSARIFFQTNIALFVIYQLKRTILQKNCCTLLVLIK